MTNFGIRPFRDTDRKAIIEARNQSRPAHHQHTVAEWKRDDTRRSAEVVQLRLCAGDPATAYLSVLDRNTTPRRKPDTCGIDLWVASGYWDTGVAEALYAEAVAFARSRGAARLISYLRLYTPDEPGARFLARQGFTEVDHDVPVLLDLTRFDRAKFVSPMPEDVRFFAYNEAGDTDENRHKLYDLMARLDPDVPTHDVRSESPPFEEYVKSFDKPEWDGNALLLAASEADEWVGVSQLGFQEQTNLAWTFMTGVLPEYRGRGIAYALKLRAIDAAIARGCPLILTENHEDNAPMRAINKKLGFVPDSPGISYSKNIEEIL